jgi:MerR family transcriptional regulator, light-induced transcriptional regulator
MPQARHLSEHLDRETILRPRGLFDPRAGQRHEDAVQSLAQEVIARLDRAHRAGPPQSAHHPYPEEVEALAEALLRTDPNAATDLLLRAHAAGVPVKDLSLRYLAAAARRLGEWWEDDRVSATDVVLAAGLIYGILRSLHRLLADDAMTDQPDRYRVFFSAPPGETHTLGVTMASDHFRRLGWHVTLRTQLDHDAMVQEAATGGFHVIGLSASCSSMIFPLARLIVALRVSDPSVWIMVCGKITELEPEIRSLVDADAAINDLEQAERLMIAHFNPGKRALG